MQELDKGVFYPHYNGRNVDAERNCTRQGE